MNKQVGRDTATEGDLIWRGVGRGSERRRGPVRRTGPREGVGPGFGGMTGQVGSNVAGVQSQESERGSWRDS